MIIEYVLLAIALFISVPLLVIGTEGLIGLFVNPEEKVNKSAGEPSVPYKILIPAHNEAAIIKHTLTKLINQLPDADAGNIILVADNCSDDTAKIAKSLKITVLERQDPVNRGKGFALDYGIKHILKHNLPADVLIVIDADCETDRQSLSQIISQVNKTQMPAQMVNIMRMVENASIKQKVAGFAWLVKNKIRPLALHALGLPVPLTGTGMAFPKTALPHLRLGSANIVEDTQLGIDCAINGFPPQFCTGATVYSDFPVQASAELTQRTRWEHGHLQTIIHQVPKLFLEALKQRDPKLLTMALDIGVPPLSLLVMLALAGLLGLLVLSWLTAKTFALKLLSVSFLYFAAALLAVWWRFGRGYLSAKELAGIPFYVLTKLSIYSSFLSKRQKDWVRTERDS